MLLPAACSLLFFVQPPTFIDLSRDTSRQVVVDREPGQYLGHVSTVTLADGSILAAYPKGHGKGPILLKKSRDGGRTWSDRLPTPPSFETSKETPTLFKLLSPVDGQERIVLFSSLHPMRRAVGDTRGEAWSELEVVGAWGGIVGMGDVITRQDGVSTAFFHDDGRFFTPEGKKSAAFTLYATDSRDGGLTWDVPRVLQTSAEVHLCEPGAIWSADHTQLTLLLRENRRVAESHLMTSRDEGRTFDAPRPVHPLLTGDRHTARYAQDGRVVVCFRDMNAASPTKGDFVAWVGTYDDIVSGRPGQYRVRLGDNTSSWDCGYPGLKVLPDGSFLATTYGHWIAKEQPFILAFRFSLKELDELASTHKSIDPVASFAHWLTLTPNTRPAGEHTPEHNPASVPEWPRTTGASSRPPLKDQAWSAAPLSREQAAQALTLCQSAYREEIRRTRENEWKDKVITQGDLRMKFEVREFGDKPKDGRSLFISMHGGGSVDAATNEQQWQNQIGLYKPEEGLYIAPRAPTDAWNMWHQPHIDSMFTRLIEDAVVFANVNPDRVYLMGYSAGGDGVYQLAPRMADTFAAASMMAGHPNETRPDGLRNLPFAIHMGGNDAAFNRNTIAKDWGKKLEALRAADPDGYEHVVTVHEGLGHWMKLKDAVAVPWMATHTRNRNPSRVVWLQDDVTHARFYWLGMQESDRKAGATIAASIKDGGILIERTEGVRHVELYLTDELLDLSQPVRVTLPGGSTSVHSVDRTIASIWDLHSTHPDLSRGFIAKLVIEVP